MIYNVEGLCNVFIKIISHAWHLSIARSGQISNQVLRFCQKTCGSDSTQTTKFRDLRSAGTLDVGFYFISTLAVAPSCMFLLAQCVTYLRAELA